MASTLQIRPTSSSTDLQIGNALPTIEEASFEKLIDQKQSDPKQD